MINITIGECLNIDTKANNAGFGLEYYLHNELSEDEKHLIQDGIIFCDYIIKGTEQFFASRVKGSDFDEISYNMVQFLSQKFPDEIKEIVNESTRTKECLTKIINNQERYSEEDIRKMQGFFNKISTPFLNRSMNISRSRTKKW